MRTIEELQKAEELEKRKENIENVISDIMVNDGPDGHCDGANVIADFVMALLQENEKEWVNKYFENKNASYFKGEI